MIKALTLCLLLWFAAPLWAAAQPSVAVQTAPVQPRSMTDTLTGFGVVRPDPEAQTTMDATYAAFVQRLYVTLGEPVAQGDPLLTLRTAPSARANYRSAQANVHFARQKVARTRKLLKQQLATHADVNAAEQAMAQAKAAFAAQNALGTGQKTRVIKAPFAGIVSRLPIQPGNQVTVGTPLFQLAKRDRLQVALGIEPGEYQRVEKSMAVQVLPLFGAGQGVTSQITQVNAVVDPNTRLVNVIVPLNGATAEMFLPGMRVKGVLKLVAHKTLAVPRSAVLHDSQGDYLFVVRKGKAQRVNVQTGLENNGLIGVAGHLKAATPIVIQGNYELSDGMDVRVQS